MWTYIRSLGSCFRLAARSYVQLSRPKFLRTLDDFLYPSCSMYRLLTRLVICSIVPLLTWPDETLLLL